jgi:hypothetical protein
MPRALPSLSLLPILVVHGCSAVQPKPQCKAQPADYAAKYVVQGAPQGACDDRVPGAEVLHVQYYRATLEDPNQAATIGIEPASVEAAIAAGDEAMVMVKSDSEFSLGRYQSTEPGDDDICLARTMSETSVMVAEIPADPMAMPPVEGAPAKSLDYKWSNVAMLTIASSNAVYFGADLVRREDDCTVTYKVSAVSPAVFCGDGKDAMGMPDPTTGKPDATACDSSIQGTGLNQSIDYVCDASADDMSGSHLCLPKDQFPALKR